jgi:hypothetical protein
LKYRIKIGRSRRNNRKFHESPLIPHKSLALFVFTSLVAHCRCRPLVPFPATPRIPTKSPAQAELGRSFRRCLTIGNVVYAVNPRVWPSIAVDRAVGLTSAVTRARHCQRSEAIQPCAVNSGLLRRLAPRNEGDGKETDEAPEFRFTLRRQREPLS